jgi:hypothetical protein
MAASGILSRKSYSGSHLEAQDKFGEWLMIEHLSFYGDAIFLIRTMFDQGRLWDTTGPRATEK